MTDIVTTTPGTVMASIVVVCPIKVQQRHRYNSVKWIIAETIVYIV